MFLDNLRSLISKKLVPSRGTGPVLSYDVIKVKYRGQEVKIQNHKISRHVIPHLTEFSELNMIITI